VVTRRLRMLGLAVAAGLVAGTLGVTVASAQQDDAPPKGTDDTSLLARLDVLEPQLPAEPAPTGVTIDADGSWGTFEGDVTGAAATLGTLERDLLSLYVDADDGETPVAAAVADVARGWLDLRFAYDQLAAWEAGDLSFPLDASDEEGIATDADELRGRAESGLRLVLTARERHLAGYVALRELGAADPEAQQRFDARAADSEVFDQDVRPLVGRLVSLRSTQVLVPVDRFVTSAPGVDARARSMRVACVDRGAYTDATTTTPVEGAAEVDVRDVEAALGLLGPTAAREDCPALAEEQEVRLDDADEADDEE
jgi:hypothetical protein